MIDPLAVDIDALAQRGVTLAARRDRRVAMVAAGGHGLVTPVPMVTTADDRAGDEVMMTTVASRSLESGARDVLAVVVATVLHDSRPCRHDVVAMMAVVAGWRGGRRSVMTVMVTMHRGGVRAPRENGGGERQGGDDGA
jgi:hypothetical protein